MWRTLFFWQVDESIFHDERGNPDLPDGLVHFRMNLVELLVDICQLLGSATFIQKVLLFENMGYISSFAIYNYLLLLCKCSQWCAWHETLWLINLKVGGGVGRVLSDKEMPRCLIKVDGVYALLYTIVVFLDHSISWSFLLW